MAKKLRPAAPPKRRQTRTIDKKPAFLAAFVACADLTRAAEAVGLDRSNHYQWLDNDPKYKAAFERAKIQAGQTVKDSAIHWALVGIDEPIIYQGQFQFAERNVTLCLLPDGREVREEDLPQPIANVQVVSRRTITEKHGPPLTVRRRSEGLHARAWKAFFPEDFADRGAVELTGKNGGPIDNTFTIEFVRPEQDKT